MKERPILFSAPMVRAILAGGKTQTRRIIKPQPNFIGSMSDACTPFKTLDAGLHAQITPPYGQPGDRLWVRERCELTTDDCEPGCMSVRYLADGEVRDIGTGMPDSCPGLVDWINGRWSRPSIHMPRWASRITLEITGVRAERLQDISTEDAIAEGVSVHQNHHGKPRGSIYSPVSAYRDMWESINGDGSWSANPWVWVISFRRIEACS